MPIVGKVGAIWRYPVKSMGGERLPGCRVDEGGVPGDRGWAVRDEEAGEIRGAKKLPGLLQCTAAYLRPPTGGEVPPATITLPDGAALRSDDDAAAAALSALLGRPVTLWPRQPARHLDHYRLARRVTTEEIRRQLGVGDGEPDPDLSELPLRVLLKLSVFATPPGTYFDAYPLHLLTTASLEAMRRADPRGSFDPRRFRPNFLIETREDVRGLAENAWCGATLKLGQAVLRCEVRTIRCAMPARPQPGLCKDPYVLQAVRDHAERHLGVYATVLRPGTVEEGDPVELTRTRFPETRSAYEAVKKTVKRTLLKHWG